MSVLSIMTLYWEMGKKLLSLIQPFLAKGAVLTEIGGLFQYSVTFTEKANPLVDIFSSWASISTDEASSVCLVTTMTSITGLLPSLNIEEEVITGNKSLFNSFYGMI